MKYYEGRGYSLYVSVVKWGSRADNIDVLTELELDYCHNDANFKNDEIIVTYTIQCVSIRAVDNKFNVNDLNDKSKYNIVLIKKVSY